jgi:hypothetical protein
MLVSAEYYGSKEFEGGEDIPALESALMRAEDVINTVTGGRCDTPSTLAPYALDRLKCAVCLQAEFYIRNGYDREGMLGDYTVRIGDFSYSGGSAKSSSGTSWHSPLCESAKTVLLLAGLLYTGVGLK